jgi:hypothetical protein
MENYLEDNDFKEAEDKREQLNDSIKLLIGILDIN